jgi:hypothetical protein
MFVQGKIILNKILGVELAYLMNNVLVIKVILEVIVNIFFQIIFGDIGLLKEILTI